MEEAKRKRERSANYTPEEKTLVLDLVHEYKHIIEDKRTGGAYLAKKRETWLKIASKFNSCATSEERHRTVDQLKMLYDNWKQKIRKDVAENNKAKYSISSEGLKIALQQAREEKIKNTVKERPERPFEPQIKFDVSNMEIQVEPLPNPFDSGADYFNDLDYENENNTEDDEYHNSIKEMQREQERIKQNRKAKIAAERAAACAIMKGKNIPSETFKRIYFKRKCQVANLEKKKILLEIQQQEQQHNLKMEILKLKLQKSHDTG